MKKIVVKFGNLRCADCGTEITVGQEAWYHNTPHTRLVFCSTHDVADCVRSWVLQKLADASMRFARASELLNDSRIPYSFRCDAYRERFLRAVAVIENSTERLHTMSDDELLNSIDAFAKNLSSVISIADDVLEFARKHNIDVDV